MSKLEIDISKLKEVYIYFIIIIMSFVLNINNFFNKNIDFDNNLMIFLGILFFLASLLMIRIRNHIGQYLFIFSIVCLIVVPLLNKIFGLVNFLNLHIEYKAAANFLIMLISCEVVIFALIVSLSYVSMQLAAQAYSNRVINAFIYSTDFWTICFIYIFSILSTSNLLKVAEIPIKSDTYFYLYFYICFHLFIFSMLSIVLYLFNISKILIPSNILEHLFLKLENAKPKTSTQVNSFEAIVDITYKALLNCDDRIVLCGLNYIKFFIIKLISDPDLCPDNGSLLNNAICNTFLKFATFSLKDKQDTISESLINILDELACAANEKKPFSSISSKAILSLERIGLKALELKMYDLLYKSILSIKSIGENGFENGSRKAAIQATKTLGEIGYSAISNDTGDSAEISRLLADIATRAFEHSWPDVVRYAILALGKIAAESMRQKKIGTLNQSIESLKGIWIKTKGDAKLKDLLKSIDIELHQQSNKELKPEDIIKSFDYLINSDPERS